MDQRLSIYGWKICHEQSAALPGTDGTFDMIGVAAQCWWMNAPHYAVLSTVFQRDTGSRMKLSRIKQLGEKFLLVDIQAVNCDLSSQKEADCAGVPTWDRDRTGRRFLHGMAVQSTCCISAVM